MTAALRAGPYLLYLWLPDMPMTVALQYRDGGYDTWRIRDANKAKPCGQLSVGLCGADQMGWTQGGQA